METKVCRVCNKEKNDTEFHALKVKNGKTYRRGLCMSCRNEANSQYRRKKARWFYEYKNTLECEMCGYSRKTHDSFSPQALQFHHFKGGKEFDLGDGVSLGYSKENIIKESNKCKVLCSRCHAEEHDKYN